MMDRLVSYDRHPLRAGVGLIDCPTLILHGRRDNVCSWTNALWLADRIGTRDVSVRIFENSAHVLACDGERAEVAREVVTFLARTGSVAYSRPVEP
jgi:esterase/lipase